MSAGHSRCCRNLQAWLLPALLALPWAAAAEPPEYDDLEAPPHRYSARTPADPVTRLKAALESGTARLDRTNELAFLTSFLRLLDIPVSSQALVFSTTSLQLSLISPSNPRAIYFNDEMSVGFIPGGRIEVISMDPELGAIFYIFDVPREDRPIRLERSGRCMNCHAGEETGRVPGWVVKSVMPGPGGGSLTAYRLEQSGHVIPLEERFGGWHVTGDRGATGHRGNLTGRMAEGKLTLIPNPPGERFRWERYPARTSDLLAQLLLEHQSGFLNRVVEAGYRARTALQASPGGLSREQETELDAQAAGIVRYLLFKDEMPLPAGGIEPDAQFREDFARNRRAVGGVSLKDLDLRTRLFRHRCSYMIYSPVLAALPETLRSRIHQRLDAALRVRGGDPEFAHLPPEEKESIRTILRATLPGLPKGW